MTTSSSRPGEQPPGAEGGAHSRRIPAYRDDGPIACALGRLTSGRLPALAPVLVAALATAILLIAGAGDQHVPAPLVPVLVLLLAGSGSAHPHTGRLDWLVPAIVRAIEYGYLATLGFSHAVPKPLVYALLGVLAYHHYDTVNRTRQGPWPTWVIRAGLGWDGRMLIAGIGAATRIATPVYLTLTIYLAALFAAESIHAWVHSDQRGAMADDAGTSTAGGDCSEPYRVPADR
jgi:hypothetical protein